MTRQTAPTVVAQRQVNTESHQPTVSTIRIASYSYDTAIIDESPNKKHPGMLIGGYVTDESSKRAAAREALTACRDETPKETR
ncbi:hypothetical protein ACFXI8_27245 [Streptomyces niveus]|uniref:hypothetical protein n=1 Tax=Streptomyces niveus TaxID=193462 RepID=UPI0036B64272